MTRRCRFGLRVSLMIVRCRVEQGVSLMIRRSRFEQRAPLASRRGEWPLQRAGFVLRQQQQQQGLMMVMMTLMRRVRELYIGEVRLGAMRGRESVKEARG